MRDPIGEAEALLAGLVPGGGPLRINPPLAVAEARWFLEAIAKNVVSFVECDPACQRRLRRGASGADEFVTPSGQRRHLFSSPDKPEPSLNREYVPHIAAFARAVIQYGYDINCSAFSRYRTFTRDLITKRIGQSYETDGEFYDDHDRIFLQIEAKRLDSEVEVMANAMAEFGSLTEMPAKVIKEIEYVIDLAPRYLWIVGPGSVDPARHVFAVTVNERTARFDSVPEVPAPPKSTTVFGS